MTQWLINFAWIFGIGIWMIVATILCLLGPIYKRYWTIPLGIIWLCAGFATELYFLQNHIW
jgi:hypothetical protein